MGKKKKGKLPRHVLGVKVPKELRKAGERLIEQAQAPAGRQAIAGALTAVAGAAVSAALSHKAQRMAAESVAAGHAPEEKSKVRSGDAVDAQSVNAVLTALSALISKTTTKTRDQK
ncbi:hypothetical protein [Sphingomonas endophytica]|uniref:hypothetical protein n=1 Tax=Sphingomonas endophytica TaxID=869719 RepID=UPI0007377D08|nr:hypothetical protein [Sphingomonas endophytica]